MNDDNDRYKPLDDAHERLDRIRAQMDDDNWQTITHERRIRSRFKKFPGVSDGLIDSTILVIVEAMVKRNNRVSILPIANQYGHIHCFLCSSVPVVSAMAVIPDRDPPQGHEDVTIVSFICRHHANNIELTMKEIDERHMLSQLLQMRLEMTNASIE